MRSSIRLLFLLPTSSVAGGVQTWLDEINDYLTTQNFKVTVGLLRGQKFNQPERYHDAHPQLSTLEVDGRGCNRDGRVRALMRCIKKVKPDIVIPLGIADAYEAVIRCKQKGMETRLVIHAQGNLEPMLADLAMYGQWIDQVICPGCLTAKVLIQWGGIVNDRVHHIPNGANTPRLIVQPSQQGNPVRIGYIGRLTSLDKRALDLIALHEELEKLNVNYQLDIVGDGPCFAQLSESLGNLAPKVKLHGALSRDTVYQEIFPNLDVLVLLSSSEAFGIVIVEALMHGVIPVTSRYAGFYAEGLVKEHETGLSFPVGDMAQAARQILRVAEDSGLRQRLSENARIHGQQYTWENSLTSWKTALEAVMERPPLVSLSLHPLPQIPTTSGRLDRLGVPAGVIDGVRRLRRSLIGSLVPAGGEEWPLFYRHHSESLLKEISAALKELDVNP
ncbi:MULTISPECIES: glycosyltransferase family 4 protein [unclassified Synechocystis]|uniref:glycosyltransferase family 4 protein n=1 Tax=unclassified Synechocystis TaxID=2640012 RepID=UPI000403867F|nr:MULTISPECIES: glycosyltransferase family 4 protein [unclassified Synechocystis]AIE74667.1 hypothetical protein D082_21390 [Synechocystis sp. PCC 6714]MCT0253977.1 glycosyltransferase family 4 protein [Synechocystis sp. CS-94]